MSVIYSRRRAHLKDCFDTLKSEVLDPEEEKKASHLAVLKSAVRCIRVSFIQACAVLK